MVTKYELKKATREVRLPMGKKAHEVYHEGITLEGNDIFDKRRKSFDTPDKALEALKEYRCDYYVYKHTVGEYLEVTEYYVEENIYDDDGEFVDYVGIYEFAALDEQLALDASATELFDEEEYIDEQDEEMEL